MKILVAPDSFKESLTAAQAAAAIAAGLREVFPQAEVVELPLADGGEGTTAALVAASGGQLVCRSVRGPLGEPIEAAFGLSGDGRTVFVELAAASGLMLVPPAQRNPLLASTCGTGELLCAALDAGATRIVIGLGGSATCDGGAGLLRALGMRFHDGSGQELEDGGGALARLTAIDASGLDPRLSGVNIEAACDVDNPLLGPRGAAAVFAPQKGATPEMVAQLEANLARFAALVRDTLGIAVADQAGAGAAGGAGAAILAIGGRLRPGCDVVLDALDFDRRAADADLIVTGEGRIDAQSCGGKVPVAVARRAARLRVPVVALAGSLGSDAEMVRVHGITALLAAVSAPCTLEEALAAAGDNLRRAAGRLGALLHLGGEIGAGDRGRRSLKPKG